MTLYSAAYLGILDEMCEGLLARPADAWAAACASPFGIARTLDPFVQADAIAECFTGADDFAAALRAREPKLVTFAPELLARLDAERGIALARKAFALEPSAPLDVQVRASARRTLEGLAARLPLAEVLDLAAADRFFQPNLLAHPEVTTPAAYHEALDRLDSAPKDAPAWFSYTRAALYGRLFDAGDEAVVGRALAVWNDATHPYADQIGTVLWPRQLARVFEGMAARAEAIAEDAAAPAYQREQSEAALVALGRVDAYVQLVFSRAVVPSSKLYAVAAYVKAGKFPADHRAMIDAAVALLGRAETAAAAKFLLSALDKKAVKAALDAVGVGKKPAKAPAVPVPARLDFLERYEAGEHEAVWRELTALGATVNDPAVAAVALAVARATMGRLAKNLDAIVRVLQKHEYALDLGKKALAPAKDAEKKLAALEKAAGAPLPLSIRAFYERFEQVSLAEKSDAMTDAYTLDPDLGRWDPLVVMPLTVVTKDLKTQAATNKALIAALRAPLSLYLSPTTNTKYDPGGEYPDEAPARLQLGAMDGIVTEGEHAGVTFIDWLRAFVRRGGFRTIGDSQSEAALTAAVIPF